MTPSTTTTRTMSRLSMSPGRTPSPSWTPTPLARATTGSSPRPGLTRRATSTSAHRRSGSASVATARSSAVAAAAPARTGRASWTNSAPRSPRRSCAGRNLASFPVVPAEVGIQSDRQVTHPFVVSPSNHQVHPSHPYWFSDTRPFRERPSSAYAGCMTVVPTAPIGRVYASRLSYRQRLWFRRTTFDFVGHLVQLSREAGHGLANTLYKVAKVARLSMRFTRNAGNKVARFNGRLATLFARSRPSPAKREPVCSISLRPVYSPSLGEGWGEGVPTRRGRLANERICDSITRSRAAGADRREAL